jgi:predicted methyltransferase
MRSIAIVFLGFLLTACDQAPEATTAQTTAAPVAAEPAAAPDPYEVAVADEGRSDADRARDAVRRPAEVLRFFGLEPSMQVLDVFAGGGYYTEIASQLVASDGQVVMYNNAAYVLFTQPELDARFTEGRLANVQRLTAEVADLDLPEASFDLALFVLAYHDVYFVNEPSWPAIDAPAFLAKVHRSLRPGAIVGVVDHAAEDGAGTSVAQSLHRIERAALIADFEAAGFVLDAESDLLANPADDRSQHMTQTDIRGHTDRFVLRFLRP